MKALVAQTMERFGKIDVLVNNAALFAPLQENQVHRDRYGSVGPRHGHHLRGPFLIVSTLCRV